MSAALLHGLLLSFGLILPLGVQNLFIFQQGIYHRKWVNAVPAVLTAAICDSLLILAAVMGVFVLLLQIAWIKILLVLAGVLFLSYLGWCTWRSVPVKMSDMESQSGILGQWTWKKQIGFSASVSLLNPHAIMDTIGVIGTSSMGYVGLEKTVFTGSTILVSWLWFFGLMAAGNMMGRHEKLDQIQKWLNKVSALFIWGGAMLLAKKFFLEGM